MEVTANKPENGITKNAQLFNSKERKKGKRQTTKETKSSVERARKKWKKKGQGKKKSTSYVKFSTF